MLYSVFGCGSPIHVNSTCPEGAEMIVVDAFGVNIDRLTTVRADHDVLRRDRLCDGSQSAGLHSDTIGESFHKHTEMQ